MLRSLVSLSLPETHDKREKAFKLFKTLEPVIWAEENPDEEKKPKKAGISEKA